MRTVIEHTDGQIIEAVCDADLVNTNRWINNWSHMLTVSDNGGFLYGDTWESYPPRPVRLVYLPRREDES